MAGGTNSTDLLSGGEDLDDDIEVDDEDLDEVEEDEEEDEPPAEHPRFKKIYGRLKQKERDEIGYLRRIEALDRELAELRAKAATPDKEPDSMEDPEGWKKWNERKAASDREAIEAREKKARLDIQIEACRTVYDDYDKLISKAVKAMDRNPALAKKIWASPNPAKAAYQWAKSKQEKDDEGRDSLRTDEAPERGGHRPKRRTVDLTRDEREAAAAMGISPEDWVKNRDAIPSVRERLVRR
jgi:hypothetical protein